jgi:hypothetical protein
MVWKKALVRGKRFAKGGAAEIRHHHQVYEPTNYQDQSMTTKSIAKACVLTAGILSLPAFSYAGQEVKETKEVIEKCKESCISGDLGVNIVSQYISRGVIFENQGGIIEPYADLYFKLYEGEGFLNKVTVNLGTWDSFHSRKTDAGLFEGRPFGNSSAKNSSTAAWYECDFTGGVSFTFLKNFTLTPSYYVFLSPNDGFETFKGLNVKLAYDDTDLLGKFALHPYAQVLFELEGKAGTGPHQGQYFEIGVAPSAPVGPVTVTVPLTVGLGANDFYGQYHTSTATVTDETFGYFSAGVTLSYTMKFIPECYGTWTATAGYTYYYLGEGTSGFNTQEAGGDVRDGKNNEHVWSGGISVAF